MEIKQYIEMYRMRELVKNIVALLFVYYLKRFYFVLR